MQAGPIADTEYNCQNEFACGVHFEEITTIVSESSPEDTFNMNISKKYFFPAAVILLAVSGCVLPPKVYQKPAAASTVDTGKVLVHVYGKLFSE